METGGQDTLGQSIAAADANARIIIVGVTPGTTSPIPDYVALILRNICIRGIANGNRAMFEALIDAVAQGDLPTHVDRVFPFDEAPEAVRYFAAAGHVGKVMIALPGK